MTELINVSDWSRVADPPSSNQTARRAVAALERWRHWVRRLPSQAGAEHWTALRGLVAWYERVCVDDRYAGAPPAEAMDALRLVEHEGSGATTKDLVAARWAVRVAESLVKYRQAGGNAEAIAVPQAQLEVALNEALERIGPSMRRGHRPT